MTHQGAGGGDGRADGAWWAGGLSLADRLPAPPPPPFRSETSGPDASAVRRLDDWRQDHTGAGSGRLADRFADRFAERLADAGLDESGLYALLVESPAALAARVGEPAWAGYVHEALAAAPAKGRPARPGTDWSAGFAAVLAPFTAVAVRRLTAAPAWVAAARTADPDALRGCFATALAADLVRAARRTLVLELNVLRVTGSLDGATGEERFADFVRQVSARPRLTVLTTEYPVLARLLAQTCLHAVDAWTELLTRYSEDRTALVDALFDGRDPGRLVEVEVGAGDRHQRGRSVAVLRFADGRRAVHKPRPPAVHRHFNDLVEQLNTLLPGTALRTLALLTRPAYGWAEFAEARPCADRAALDRFYHRLGVLLALLHLLGGTDIHYENLVACGDQPVLVDLETLFHPATGGAEQAGGDPALRVLADSVHRIALLPFLLVGEHGAVDLSGLGGDRDAVLPTDVAAWEAAGTDEMRLVRGPARLRAAANRPRVGDTDAVPEEHTEALVAGFRAGYRALAEHAAELAAPDGPLARFAADPTRVVVRPTRRYAALLEESTHPDALRDGLDRDRLLDLLWRESADDPARRPLVAAELADLWAGDVPLFTTTPAARTLTLDGRPIGRPWDDSGLDRARQRLTGMDRTDLYDQEWIIRAALATRRERHLTGPAAGPIAPQPPAVPDPERLLAAAGDIADRILARAHGDGDGDGGGGGGGGRVNWLTLEPVTDRRWALMPQGAALDGGYAGTALFLAQLAALTGTERYAEVARRAVRPLPGLLAALADHPDHLAAVGPGAFTGLAGIAYTLARLAPLLDDTRLLDGAAEAVRLTALAAEQRPAVLDAGPDAQLLSGDAGCLAAMLAVHRATGLAGALTTAHGCAQRLALDPEDTDPPGTDPPGTGAPGTPGAPGTAHRAADAAHRGWALRRYAAATGRGAYERPALRHLYAALADHPEQLSGPAALTLADSGLPAGTLSYARFLDRTVERVVGHGPAADHSLLHGEAGLLELLGAAAPCATVATRAGTLLAALDRYGPRCATPVPTPGLLTGLAGIGYTLLRLGFPSRTPSVLLLDPPATLPVNPLSDRQPSAIRGDAL
ncbi:type 2 lanthipeptide synthetase LanM family protein [Kitasatospora paracochleata]|uniref:Type 2 lantibiotic biosynthesis protein LanM n=2 Tax=Kitasatospora paracochleata TaxID=58354 RepID=A0ABT1JA54_9ACTN|nr:type 2 lanthipeptide synthetase LanM family protein [Kitasatospora paracochleata]MCP2314325.1 type 2 lantibiotic biosynthesis protein LanM [Kitasatospora paracochleata]